MLFPTVTKDPLRVREDDSPGSHHPCARCACGGGRGRPRPGVWAEPARHRAPHPTRAPPGLLRGGRGRGRGQAPARVKAAPGGVWLPGLGNPSAPGWFWNQLPPKPPSWETLPPRGAGSGPEHPHRPRLQHDTSAPTPRPPGAGASSSCPRHQRPRPRIRGRPLRLPPAPRHELKVWPSRCPRDKCLCPTSRRHSPGSEREAPCPKSPDRRGLSADRSRAGPWPCSPPLPGHPARTRVPDSEEASLLAK